MTSQMEDTPQTTELAFDPEALREKYRRERDKRLRPDGNDQYIEVKGEFADYMDDPYVEPGFRASTSPTSSSTASTTRSRRLKPRKKRRRIGSPPSSASPDWV